MPRYLIERNLAGVHTMSEDELREGAGKSCQALANLGPDIQWLQSFITEDKITCIYIAKDDEIIREHARLSGFPAHSVREVLDRIDPTTAEPKRTAVAEHG